MRVSDPYRPAKIPIRFGGGWPADVSVDRDEDLAAELRLEKARWKMVALGAIALYLFFIVVLFWGPVWLVVVGPFVLLILGRLMGIRPLGGDRARVACEATEKPTRD